MATSAKKKNKPRGKPFKNGHDARRSTSGGRTGRPRKPETLTGILCRTILEDAVPSIQKILRDPKHPYFVPVLDRVLDRAYGPVPEAAAPNGNGAPLGVIGIPVMMPAGLRKPETVPAGRQIEAPREVEGQSQ